MSAHATLRIYLPRLYDRQLEIKRHPAKRKVIATGRRAGKTTLGADIAVDRMLDGRRELLASTSQDQADTFWRYIKRWCREPIEHGLIEKNETKRTLEMGSTGGSIKVKTAFNADMLRGDFADDLLLDEAAYLAPDAWYEVGAPMLLDTDGDAYFFSSPNRRNWFFELYQRGVADGDRWASWNFSSFDNPHLSASALAEISSDLTEAAYRQEILAEFLEGEGAVFRRIAENLTAPENARPEDHRGHVIVMGGDWARQNDYTALSVACATCRVELALDRFNKIDWAFQRDRLKSLGAWWGVRFYLLEANSIGGPNIEALQGEGLPVAGFETTGVSKPPLIRSLALALERLECRWLPDPVAKGELEAYEEKVTASGRSQFSAPEGLHDDTVIARALAWKAALEGGPALTVDAAERLGRAGARR